MQRGQKIMTVLGLVLGAFGIVLLNFGNEPTKSNAATDYNATWKATKLYRLHNRPTGGGGFTISDLGGIGVKAWAVSGTIGDVTYTETWEGPRADSISFTGINQKCVVNADPKVWFGSCLWFGSNSSSPPGDYWLTEEAVDSFVRSGRIGDASYAGSGAYCREGVVAGCWSVLGTYGFGRNKSEYIGMMMPLQWTVVGTIQ